MKGLSAWHSLSNAFQSGEALFTEYLRCFGVSNVQNQQSRRRRCTAWFSHPSRCTITVITCT